MDIRFYIDPETGYPHIYRHGVDEYEVEDVLLDDRTVDLPSRRGASAGVGQTSGGRYLLVVWRDGADNSVFVITAYEPNRKARAAYRRRRERRSGR